MKKVRSIFLSVAVFGLSACGGDSNENLVDVSGTGQLSLAVTDGPIDDAQNVNVAFSGIVLQPADGDRIEISFPDNDTRVIDLLAFQNGESATLLDEEDIPVGDYNWIRLLVEQEGTSIVFKEDNDTAHELQVPSSENSGLKMNRSFTVAAGTTTDFIVDFVLRKSVHQQGNGVYKLRPTVRLVDRLEVNTIEGTVTGANCGDEQGSVYLYRGLGAVVQDIQGNENDPITTANVSDNDTFTIGFVETDEDYTVSFTCDADEEDGNNGDNDNSEMMVFSAGVDVTVTDGDAEMVEINVE